jgi:hypothetical protein
LKTVPLRATKCERLIRAGQHVEVTIEKAKPKSDPPRETIRQEKNTGFCIRCAASIPLNREKPYCADHYREWSKWKNPDYGDKFCHACGEERGATMNKPLCRDCYSSR